MIVTDSIYYNTTNLLFHIYFIPSSVTKFDVEIPRLQFMFIIVLILFS